MLPLVSIADAVRVLATLKPADDASRAAMLSQLGFDTAEASEAATSSDASPPEPAPPPEPRLASPDEARPVAPVAPSEDAVAALPLLEPLSGYPEADVPLEDVVPLPQEEAAGVGDRLAGHEPLFTRKVARSKLMRLLRTELETHELDVDRVVEALARQWLVTSLPRKREPSLVRGVQVLIDRAEAMEPFLLDVDRMLLDVELLFGIACVQRVWFRDSVWHGAGRERAWTWGRYLSPPPGTPVLVLTALGIGVSGHGVRQGWVALSRLLRARGSDVVAFVPYPSRRWPAGLSRLLNLVHWDRSRWRLAT
jgi:hypothetical protein